ncbi:hypothetical protein EZS27_027296 [termite gut metagenome]|uniref:Uncharacterized protein n=1 Tax=termite gut metagenome TaxID=433724 RepID=A0A5J4QQ52_9ZZZZ
MRYLTRITLSQQDDSIMYVTDGKQIFQNKGKFPSPFISLFLWIKSIEIRIYTRFEINIYYPAGMFFLPKGVIPIYLLIP